MSPDLIERQYALEEESVMLGRKRYEEELEYAQESRNEDTTRPGIQLMRRAMEPVVKAIDADRSVSRRGRSRSALALIEELEASSLAWHGLRALMRGLTSAPTYSSVVSLCGRSVRDELEYRNFRNEQRRKYNITQEHLKTHASAKSRARIMSHLRKGEGITRVGWTDEDIAHVGAYVMDIVLQVTGWATVINRKKGNKTQTILEPSPKVLEWLDQAHSALAELTPVHLPMLVKPRPWTNTRNGGTLTGIGGLTLVKTMNERYLDELDSVEMPEVYAAVNALQNVGWRINGNVLGVAKVLWDMGVQVGQTGHESLPPKSELEVPASPPGWDGLTYTEIRQRHPEEYKLWAGRAAAIHDHNRRMVSKRATAAQTLALAERFQEDTIHFPYQADFRSRLYPVTTYLSPQGDDLSKALLKFSEGKRLGHDGVIWLMIHAANSYGEDKVPFEDRVRWTQSHMDQITAVALDPIETLEFWTKADSPFQFLAACFELAGAHIMGPDYVSYIPVSMDGSCNGLQNFSALLKDAVGGAATNLVPSDAPADIYSEVAALVEAKVRHAAEAGHEFGVIFDGFINRTLIKQPVMTLPYGATLVGMQGQLEAACKKAGNPMALTPKNSWPACGWLARVVRESIAEVVVAAVEAMDWLQDAAVKVSKTGQPIRWTTPAGFPVLQEYRIAELKRVAVHVDGKRVRVGLSAPTKQIDTRRQGLGIAPNYVHSLDASHLMKTTNLAVENGITSFAMVHDSFGTHAADVGTLQACIREAFISQYESDVLGRFKAEVEDQTGIVLPELPDEGDLDLDLIREASYFFA